VTWVIGACPILGGYALTVSDIQVTTQYGRTFDLLRKAYPVGPNIVGGFAGSVLIGFKLLDSLTTFLRLGPEAPENASWHPAWVAENWSPLARTVFQSADEGERSLGCQFILVGPDPVENAGDLPRAMPYLCKFSAPDFSPDITRGGHSAISIGSGANVPEYLNGIRDMMNISAEDQGGALRLEVHNLGGWANWISIAVAMLLDRTPTRGISPHVHTHVVGREGFRVMTSDRRMYIGTPGQREIRMPRVAQSFAELVAMAREFDIDAAHAIA
jgi:hypothetical protein